MSTPEPCELTGQDGELIALLCDVLDEVVGRSQMARELVRHVLEGRLGGFRPRDLHLEPSLDVVEQLRSRLSALAATGLWESILVRATREDMDRALPEPDIGRINRNRQQLRDRIEESDLYRSWPETPAERAERGGVAGDLGPDAAVELWSRYECWRDKSSLHLSDERIHLWERRRGLGLSGPPAW